MRIVLIGFLLLAASWPWCAYAALCDRIVTLAPSLTETAYELGLGPKVVGNTRFCRYPDDARAKPKVGGFLDVNIELLVTLRPTVVFALREHGAIVSQLEKLGMKVVSYDHSRIDGIRESIEAMATLCGVSERSKEILAGLDERTRTIRAKTAGTKSPRVLVSVGRTNEGKSVSSVYVSGNDGFYSDLLALVGASNVNSDRTIAVPTVSAEGLMALDPDAIVEIVNTDDDRSGEESLHFWRGLSMLRASRENRIIVFDEDYASVPGPRYILLAEKLARGLFPDRFK